MDLIWLIPLLPAAGAALNAAGIRWFSRLVSGAIACAAMGTSLLVSLTAFAGLLRLEPSARAHEVAFGDWIPAIPLITAGGMGAFHVRWALHLDPLSAVMALVVTGIGLVIHVYATAFMHDEPRGSYARFFCYLNLFCAFMLVLVLGSNFLVMFVGWEGVGLCSYLLIGYWYERTSAASAGFKAFLTNRIGDWGFVVGMLLVFFTFGTLDFKAIATAAAAMPVESTSFGTLSLICLLLFMAATGKSAQLPLHVWLPAAMEGPIPVSALIHAATIVTAGVYIVARNAVLFSHAPLVLQIVAILGVLTAVMAATIGLVQHDIKGVLAYSTVSQLGYMFLAAGTGAFAAAIFHLVTHAFFKALLFLGSGAVIYGMAGEQDMRRLGGLKTYMPVTYVTTTIGALAISAVPPLSGFFSEDAILSRAFTYNRVLWALGLLTAGLTAFYIFRLVFLTFFGEYRGLHPTAHTTRGGDPGLHPTAQRTRGGDPGESGRRPLEPPTAMRLPLIVLAVGAIVAGFFGLPAWLAGAGTLEHFLTPAFGSVAPPPHLSPAAEFGLMLVSVAAASLGIVGARRLYADTSGKVAGTFPEKVAGTDGTRVVPGGWSTVQPWLLNGYYLDDFYDTTLVRGTLHAARRLWVFDHRVVDGAVTALGWITQIASWCSHMFDKYVVDGLVNLAAVSAGEGSYLIRRMQTGLVQNYALLIVLGLFAFLTLFLIAR